MNTLNLQKPIYPKSVAIWLIENTSLTFNQIANYCNIHVLEVEALANEEIHKTLKGLNPIITGEVSEEDIHNCEKDPNLNLTYIENTEYNDLRNTAANKKTKTKKRKA